MTGSIRDNVPYPTYTETQYIKLQSYTKKGDVLSGTSLCSRVYRTQSYTKPGYTLYNTYDIDRCNDCGESVNWTNPVELYLYDASKNTEATASVETTQPTITAQSAELRSCLSTDVTLTFGSGEVVIDGGTYQGAPAVSAHP